MIWKGFCILMNRRKKTKRVVCVIVTIAILILTGRGEKKEPEDKMLRVGVVTYKSEDPFINEMTDKLKK